MTRSALNHRASALRSRHVNSINNIAALSGLLHAHDSINAVLPSHKPKCRRMKSVMPV
jgi:hypothetical protein